MTNAAPLRIVQLGLGSVGQALLRHYLSLADRYPWLGYAAVADRSGLCWIEDGWTVEQLRDALDAKNKGLTLSGFAQKLGERARFIPASASGLPELTAMLTVESARDLEPTQLGGNPKSVVVDVTAERMAYDTLLEARRRGAHVVMCNKWALAEPMERYEALVQAGSGRILYETTVGAALPVINTLDRLLQTGDEVTAIEAAISGTLGYLSTEIQRGVAFSAALKEANRLGYTEPDPRDDLAGIDARRKALILARKLGHRMDMGDVQVESLVPEGLQGVSLEEFWARLPEADEQYAGWVADAAAQGNVLRFLARIDGSGASVSMQEVPSHSLAGTLTGTESLFVFHTTRYGDQPLAVRGRGAGAEVTAAGVLADILSLQVAGGK